MILKPYINEYNKIYICSNSILNYLTTFITAGHRSSFANFWSWGKNEFGNLGNNSDVKQRSPVLIYGGNTKAFCQIAAGFDYALGLDYKGQIWCWGGNDNGQLGDNSHTNKCTPVSIKGNKKTFCQISVKYHHSMGLDHTGLIWCWGENAYGKLGDNTTTLKRSPVSILGTKKTFCKIAAGISHTIALDYLGQIWGWGYNVQGQLGNNTELNQCTPVSILGTKKTFCQIAAGRHTVGIDYTGQVWNWGDNTYGQLGNNTELNQCTPISILGTKKTFCHISVDQYQTLGIDYLGQVWSWGWNAKGQLGDNTETGRCTPVSILGTKKTFCHISTGYLHSIGLDHRGQVWSWGYNSDGQLGNNSVESRRTPIRVCNL